MKSFSDIDARLCNYCGVCVGICPVQALSCKNEKIIFNRDKCIYCGLCYSVCPGQDVPFNTINEYLFGKRTNGVLGVYKSIHVGHSNDKKIRDISSSGGVVTSLLLYLLDNKLIDGVIVVGMSVSEPWKYAIKIIKNKEELEQTSQSKYTLVPLGSIMKHIKDSEGRFALVGLPCHVHAIRKLQMRNDATARKIKYIIGLFCGFNLNFDATEYLLKKLGIEKKDIKKLEYRGGKWPGGFRVELKNGTVKFVDKFGFNLLIPMFLPDRCLLCADLTNEFADISVGDCWLNKHEKWSTFIVRTKAGEDLFTSCRNNNYIFSKPISKTEILKTHGHLIKYKKFRSLIRICFNSSSPKYGIRFWFKYPMTYFSEILFISALKITKSKYFRKLICALPLPVTIKTFKLIRKLIAK